MELSYFTLFFLIGGVLAEPGFNVLLSKSKAKQGTEVKVTCRVSNEDDSTILLKKWVEIDEVDDRGNNLLYSEDVAINKDLQGVYRDSIRHSMSSVANGNSGTDYILTISDAKPEDTATYACSSSADIDHASKTLMVYTNPDYVHFTNYSSWDLNIDILHFDEGETINVGCMAMGGVPKPRFELIVTNSTDPTSPINYTKAFTHHESQVVLPTCYTGESKDDCPLHYTTESEVEAFNFRPHVIADGEFLECRTYIDGSGLEPRSAKLGISMRYKPKFLCWEKHKVVIHSKNYELKCTILTNPYVKRESVQFEFQWDGQTQILRPGQKTSDGEIEFSRYEQTGKTETEVALTFKEVFERHYDIKYKLKASNDLGDNSTLLELVDETYVRGSADAVVCSGILALIASVMSFFVL